jgi:2-polyprenyl-6-methoxyphenol hydroxylase-like FAD-dependent oxidoreductase
MASPKDTDSLSEEHETSVVVVGAGPVGLMAAYELARLDIPCILAEQSLETTKWPKMDLTNCRTMEILRMWGLADDYRAQKHSVPDTANFDSIFVDKLAPGGKLIHKFVSISSHHYQCTLLY